MQNLSGADQWCRLPNHQKGKLGEALAVRWLMHEGFSIVLRNFRVGNYEADIVAAKVNHLFVIEVKMRFSDQYGSVEEYLSEDKVEQMKIVALALLEQYPDYVCAELILCSIRVCGKNILFSWVEI